MKKTMILLLCAMLTAHTFTGCSNNDSSTGETKQNESIQKTVETLSEAEQKAVEKETYYSSLAASASAPGCGSSLHFRHMGRYFSR